MNNRERGALEDMETPFVSMQQPIAEEPAWSAFSPELSWSTLLLERMPNSDACQLVAFSERRRDDVDVDGCACDTTGRAHAQAPKEPLRTKSHPRTQAAAKTGTSSIIHDDALCLCEHIYIRVLILSSAQQHPQAPQAMAKSEHFRQA
jgi:hypothetical protein